MTCPESHRGPLKVMRLVLPPPEDPNLTWDLCSQRVHLSSRCSEDRGPEHPCGVSGAVSQCRDDSAFQICPACGRRTCVSPSLVGPAGWGSPLCTLAFPRVSSAHPASVGWAPAEQGLPVSSPGTLSPAPGGIAPKAPPPEVDVFPPSRSPSSLHKAEAGVLHTLCLHGRGGLNMVLDWKDRLWPGRA